ncbi:6-phosphofructokinase [Longilinea arvoryzae]|uniref:ATP-dependent 6-phosphofructokinase n=1 Tax=Longilinea arvoryzae TaxID=360412 RepID=A0A0S7BFS1_9CHLR|nr:ATP-dependent 6-phosphofructokinase [Longilinea arvoryzae]GAP13828.1 6-phosphofructokinase [Longilinea arvoryzae]
MKRIAILTGGGDAPGLNAVIRAVVKTACQEYACEVLGVKDGFDGFITPGGVFPLTLQDVRGILPRGGTILGAANRGNPFARKVLRDGQEVVEDTSVQVIANLRALELDALIVVGGDGTLHIAQELAELNVPVVGVPKTIDNDIGGTEVTFGFDTAVNTATEAIDKLHTTAESHHRVMVLELMGRDAGFITLHAGLAGGADIILIPEIPFRYETLYQKVEDRKQRGSPFSIVAVAEGAHPAGESVVVARAGDSVYVPRLGGIGQAVAEHIAAACRVETRVTVLGHLQRGGSPTPFDRVLATRLGAAAVRLADAGGFGRMVAINGGRITDLPLSEALAVPRRVDPHGDTVRTARGLGICLGD